METTVTGGNDPARDEAGWVLLASLSGSEQAARDDRKAATAANQTQVKISFFLLTL